MKYRTRTYYTDAQKGLRDARDAIAMRIAQPVQAMLRLDQQLIALDPRARVIGRPQPDQLRPSSAGLGKW